MERVKRKPVARQAVECEFCGHSYIQPCDEVHQEACENIKLESNKD